MTRVVVDASALAAIAFGEPAGRTMAHELDGAAVFAPTLLQYELANIAWKKARRDPRQAAAILSALHAALADESGVMSLSRDGRHVVYGTLPTDNDKSRLWIRSLASLEARPIPGTEDTFIRRSARRRPRDGRRGAHRSAAARRSRASCRC